jgi:hypothetical protein
MQEKIEELKRALILKGHEVGELAILADAMGTTLISVDGKLVTLASAEEMAKGRL